MTVRPGEIAALRGDGGDAVLVRVDVARGSTPREAGAWMLVTLGRTLGTIGGGQLEYMVVEEARALIARGAAEAVLDVPLGPEIGQCCGGRTRLVLTRLDAEGWSALAALEEADRRALPEVMILGAGHVGRALAAALMLVPVRPVLIDPRPEELAMAPAGVETVATPMPEAMVRSAAPGTAFVILTHDHALDFLIAREALARADAAYVGMIGSRTKRVQFERWLERAEGAAVDTRRLVCPIGASGRPDKRPAVIAAFAVSEILGRLAAWADAQTAAATKGPGVK